MSQTPPGRTVPVRFTTTRRRSSTEADTYLQVGKLSSLQFVQPVRGVSAAASEQDARGTSAGVPAAAAWICGKRPTRPSIGSSTGTPELLLSSNAT